MILIRPSTEILHICEQTLQRIEAAGRTCYKSEDRITDDSAVKFVKNIISRGHESVIEHSMAMVRFICDRGVSHELVRHRLASYSQESTRYCDYTRGHVSFVIPPWVDVEPGEYTMPSSQYDIASSESRIWLMAMRSAELSYQDLRKQGWRPEQARAVLPNSLKTEIVMSANLREFRLVFKLRCAAQAHPQMRELMLPLLRCMSDKVPVIFDDLKEQYLDKVS